MSQETDAAGRRWFWLRKLQSLTGVVPVGIFLILHLFTNYFSYQGGSSFTHEADKIEAMPFLLLVEFGIVWAPILIHGILGLYMMQDAQWSNLSYSKGSNYLYFLQRVTGIIAFAFIAVHFYQIRAQKEESWTGAQLYNQTKSILDSSSPGGMVWTVIYVIGSLATIFHFSNGLRTFAMAWGITIGERAKKGAAALSVAVGLALTVFALLSLYGFHKNPCYNPDPDYYKTEVAKHAKLTPEKFVEDQSFKTCPEWDQTPTKSDDK